MRISVTGRPAERSRPGRARIGGFTLVEILVVLAITAVLAGFATLAVRGRDAQALVDEEAERLRVLLELAREEAVFRYKTLGVRFYAGGYEFFEHRDEQWLTADDEMMRPRELARDLDLRLYLDGRPIVLDTEAPKEPVPHIVVYPDGVSVPYELVIGAGGAIERTLKGSSTGRVELEEKDAKA